MKKIELKIINPSSDKKTTKYIENLSIEKLVKLCRDFCADCHDGFISNDEVYIELWLKKYS